MLILTTLCRGWDTNGRYIQTAILSLSLIFFVGKIACSQATDQQPFRNGQGGRFLETARTHEAIQKPATGPKNQPLIHAPIPPEVKELVPAQEDGRLQWIPGYWKWDQRHRGFYWIGGIWQSVPSGKRWVNGKWNQTDAGNIWVPGYLEALGSSKFDSKLPVIGQRTQQSYYSLSPLSRLEDARARAVALKRRQQALDRPELNRDELPTSKQFATKNQQAESQGYRRDDQKSERERRLRELQRQLDRRQILESQDREHQDRDQREQARSAQRQRVEVQRARMERQRAEQQQLSDQQRRAEAQQAQRRRNFEEFSRAKKQRERLEQQGRGN